MDAEALQAFLAKPYDAIISTNRVGKGSQLNPVWFFWDGESFLFSTQKASVKYDNIMRDPNISVIVNDPVTHTYVAAYGRAEIVELGRYPEFGNAIVEKYIPADQRQQFSAANLERYPEFGNALKEKYIPADQRQQFSATNQAIGQASRAVIVLKPEKVFGRAWTAL